MFKHMIRLYRIGSNLINCFHFQNTFNFVLGGGNTNVRKQGFMTVA